MKTHQGSCHCGAVRLEADLDLAQGGTKCNCSICSKLAFFSARALPDQLRVTAGEASLASYAWGTKMGQRYFCQTCGLHVFGRGDLGEHGGPFASVNIHCLDDVDPATITAMHWDGRHNNWESGLASKPWPFDPRARNANIAM